jgi:hypothetical protein
MISYFKKSSESLEEVDPKNSIEPELQNSKATPQETRIDLTSGSELSPEGKLFCARLSTQMLTQEPKFAQSTEKVNPLNNEETQENMDLLRLLANYQKVELEEAALLGVKHYLSETRQELQNQLSKEIGRKIINIESLRLKIDTLENNCKELSDWSQHRSVMIENVIENRKGRQMLLR